MSSERSTTPSRTALRPPVLLASAALLAVLLLALFRPGADASPSAFHGTPYDPPEPAPTFQLTDHTGQAATLRDHRGNAVLLFFGYTHCPDVCPLTLAKLSRVLGTMGSRADDVQILLVTVDPARDTPAALARYVERFDAPVRGLTGDPAVLERIRAAYGVYAGAGHTSEAAGHTPGHTDAIYGIDREGRLRVLMHPDAPEDELRDDILTLLAL